ncbi:11-beta-hydroxysteroid dehydrogenase-like 2 [Tasmannia lanceolata]|uniref:11-beta-hydroxysteroid dehydrogenase-like 2 n=1 Tax=Tasmannia lanceolata TaxID=3420 RepID=UPI004064861F
MSLSGHLYEPTMELFSISNMVFTIFLPPIVVILLVLFFPFYLLFKLFNTLIALFFAENMSDKVVLITGASGGIGEHMAYQYAKRGASLVLVARREQALREVADKAKRLGSPGVLVAPADVSKPEDCKKIVEKAVSHFGKLNHLVANAGITSYRLFEKFTDITDTTQIMDVNFWGSVYPTYHAIPHLRKSRGKIVVIASVGGWVPSPRLTIYSASKAALIRFYETLRSEVGSDIKITIATPGYIETDMSNGKSVILAGKPQSGAQVQKIPQDILKGLIPIGTAEECAKVIVGGACKGARYVTWPSWYGISYMIMFFVPDVFFWLISISKLGNPRRKAPRSEHLNGDTKSNPASNQMSDIKME